MNKKYLPFILVIVLGIILFFVRRFNNNNGDTKTATTTTSRKDPSSINRDHGFDRRVTLIDYTRHAKCRMECRHITQKEVEQIMEDGTINYNKSNIKAKPCPEYALEGDTDDGQHVRIVFAQCDLKTKVVTVIDLQTEWQCDCPGDDKKYKNKN